MQQQQKKAIKTSESTCEVNGPAGGAWGQASVWGTLILKQWRTRQMSLTALECAGVSVRTRRLDSSSNADDIRLDTQINMRRPMAAEVCRGETHRHQCHQAERLQPAAFLTSTTLS